MIPKYRIIIICLAAAFQWGCGYVQMIGADVSDSIAAIELEGPSITSEPVLEPNSVLMGKVTGRLSPDVPVAVVAFTKQFSAKQNAQTMKLVDYLMLSKPGPYNMFVPAGHYNLLAFIDSNRNFILEPDEFAGQYGNPDLVSLKAYKVAGDLDIQLSTPGNKRFDYAISLQKLPLRETNERALENGGTVQLYDEIFLKKYGEKGLWRPEAFIEKFGADIYAPEKYDPAKTPVLFVHGAGGTPKDWIYLEKKVDRQHFQPWFFYYPSGLRLKAASDLLYYKIKHLHETYGFERLYIVAHSMGGLVARSFINRAGTDATGEILRMFLTISTPWGGEKAARLGVNNSPVYVASWEDMAPDSQFLDDLYQKKIPPQVNFYIFFSYGGSKRMHWDANDGTVTLQSQLDPRAKSSAFRIDGFYENHTGILHSGDAGAKFEQLLAAERIAAETGTAISQPREIALAPPPAASSKKTAGLKSDPASNTPDTEHLPPDIKKYINMLTSKDSAQQRKAARLVYRRRLKYPELFDAAEGTLMKGYLINLNDTDHIDAMSWMCTLLGVSGQARYRSTLEKVARETPDIKIKRNARKNLKRLK
jgi:pimeloyl-ACP methyl ester carboxylesterase